MKQYLNALALGNGKAVVKKFTVTRAEDGRQKWQDLTLDLMSRHSITTWPNEHHSRQLVHLTAWIIHSDLRISWRNTMADVFEKVELRFCRHFSPCLRSRPSAKPELMVRLAADVKRWEIVHEYELHTEKELDTTHMTRTRSGKA